jgi:hypothetical protein
MATLLGGISVFL